MMRTTRPSPADACEVPCFVRVPGTPRSNCGRCPICAVTVSGGPFLELVDHEAPVTCIAISSNASLVVAGADDSALLVWDARPSSSLDRAPVGGAIVPRWMAAPVVCVDVCSDRILAAAEDGLMKEVALDGGELRRFDLSATAVSGGGRGARGALYVVVGRADGSLALVAWDERGARGALRGGGGARRGRGRIDRGPRAVSSCPAPTTVGGDVGIYEGRHEQ